MVVVADLGPNKKRLAQLVRMLGSSGGERRNAFTALERVMLGAGVGWTDLGDAIEHGVGKFTEDEMVELAQAARAEGVEAGIKIGAARAGNASGNGQLTLPKPAEMAEYCHSRTSRLKDDKQREFVSDMFLITRRRGVGLSAARLGYLASIYIQIGGRT
jgi:hypothetical protein